MNGEYRAIVMSMPTAYAKYRFVFNESGLPVDSVLIDLNPAYAELFQMSRDALIGKRISGIVPVTLRGSSTASDYRKLLKNDAPLKFTRHDESKGKYYQITAFRLTEDTFITLIEDISEHVFNTLKLIDANSLLIESNRKLYKDSVTDSLTQFYNHNYIREILKEEMRLSHYRKRALSIAMIDIDHFKKINDSYGHLSGDSILAKLSDLIRNHTRKQDHVGRYGGEEFLLILPGADILTALSVVDRLRKSIDNHVFVLDKHSLSLTVSCGVATFTGQDLHHFIAEADKYLYEAKRLGRNQCHCLHSS